MAPTIIITTGGGASLPVFWQYLQVVGVVMLGAVGAAIAWGQFRNAAVKLQLDLMERREAIFGVVQELISTMMRNGDVSNAEIAHFNANVAKAEYLFGSKVVGFIRRLRKHAAQLHAQCAIQRGDPGSERADLAGQRALELLLGVEEIYEESKAVFWPYMRLDVHALHDPWHRRLREFINRLRRRWAAAHAEPKDG